MLSRYLIRASLSLLIFSGLSAYAQTDCNYEERKSEFLEIAMDSATGGSRLILQAFHDLPLDEELLANDLEHIQTSRTADFTITNIIRILYLTEGQYDDQILEVLNEVPFWLPSSDGIDQQYWSENHMVMWMSGDWLLHEKFGRDIRPTLRQMLVKWLDMKIEYGFYEFFSAIYYPFTFSGVMNLVDFAEDEEIQSKAEQVAARLLSDVLLVVNDQGYYYPTCGRCNMGKFKSGSIGGVGDIARFVTGLGDVTAGRGNVVLATSEFDVTPICEAWSSDVNTTLHYGHPLSAARDIYSDLSREDRIVFQWSSGAYFHPLAAQETLWQIGNYDMWDHEEFSAYSFAQIFPPSIGYGFANITASFSRSSYIGNVEIDIFKNEGVVLTSSQDMWKGRVGYQIYPIAATIESNPVILRSGEVFPDWEEVPERRSNDHLPYVDQEDNVALVMYKPNWDLPIWGYGNKEVALKWQSDVFEEERAFDNWQLGRIDDSYIAVKKHCDEYINGIPACPDKDGQTWAIIVGNESLHGSFDDFEAMVGEAFYEERWYFNWQKFKWVYYGHIIADGKDIDHHWLGNFWDDPSNPNGFTGADPGRLGQFESNQINLFPNPASEYFTLDLHAYDKTVRSISVLNISGQEMYQRSYSDDPLFYEVIKVEEWQQGIYTLVIQNENGSSEVKRLIIAR